MHKSNLLDSGFRSLERCFLMLSFPGIPPDFCCRFLESCRSCNTHRLSLKPVRIISEEISINVELRLAAYKTKHDFQLSEHELRSLIRLTRIPVDGCPTASLSKPCLARGAGATCSCLIQDAP